MQNSIACWGGIVPGSLILLGGEPGIGKNTLLLQISLKLPCMYLARRTEIKMRAERITPTETIATS
jgi:DNA repair protein RadA/Sms